MTDDTLARLKLNLAHVPLSDEERQDVIAWLRQLADEFAQGEHWGGSSFTRLLPWRR